MAKLMTGRVRFSYVTVFEPKALSETDTPKYSVSILIPKTDVAQIERVKKGDCRSNRGRQSEEVRRKSSG